MQQNFFNPSKSRKTDKPIEFVVVGIPDGIYPFVKEAYYPSYQPLRKWIFTDVPVSEKDLDDIDQLTNLHENPVKYPYPLFTHPIGTSMETYPKENFYLISNEPPQALWPLREYRYVNKLLENAKIAFDIGTRNIYQYSPSRELTLNVIMPENFHFTSAFSGYFREENVIVRVNSYYPLVVSREIEQDPPEYTVVKFTDAMISLLTRFYAKLNVNSVFQLGGSFVGKSKYMCLITGNLQDIDVDFFPPLP